jgi:hypothetical protein
MQFVWYSDELAIAIDKQQRIRQLDTLAISPCACLVSVSSMEYGQCVIIKITVISRRVMLVLDIHV